MGIKVRAVGSAVIASNDAVRDRIQEAMRRAVEDCQARGVTDPAEIREAQRRAVETATANGG